MALRSANKGLYLPMRVWDAPVRLFHWAIVVLLPISYLAAETNRTQLHFITGYAVLVLVLFRLAWGIVGSDTARFSRFLVSPLAGVRHLATLTRREPDIQVGHNAAGGWMVLLMLLLILVQVGSGLFAKSDQGAQGPLTRHIDDATSAWLSGVHERAFNLVLALIALHLLSIAVYALVKKQDLVRPMITGKKRLPAATRAPRMASPLLAAVLLAVAAAIVAFVAMHG
jgi:cytochrome b